MKKILVLNGARHIARLIQVNLERQGKQVAIADSASSALEQIARDRPDAIFTDDSMRFLDGVDVYRSLRNHPATKDIPIYIVPPGSPWPRPFGIPELREWTDLDDDDETPQ
jgi:CheY-like chemotaxis protein